MEKVTPFELFLGVWLALFFLFLPFPTAFLPELGVWLSQLVVPVTESITGLADNGLSKTSGFSDSIHLYLQTLLLGIVALLVAWQLIRKNKAPQLLHCLRVGISYLLAFFLLKYGIEKWTHLQFPAPPPNILHASVGSLDKDVLFWTVMGTSKAYGWFMGAVEILAGILLLFRRTRYLAGFFALGIFVNIFALNIGFDISVKLLALALLLCAVFVLLPIFFPLLQFLTGTNVKSPLKNHEPPVSPQMRRVFKGIALALLIIECTFPLFEHHTAPIGRGISQQTYAVLETNQCPAPLPNMNYKQLHFHPEGYLITETFDGQFTSYPIRIPAGARQFTFEGKGSKIHAFQQGDEWVFMMDGELLWHCRRVDNQKLPLLRDSFHWTVEGMME